MPPYRKYLVFRPFWCDCGNTLLELCHAMIPALSTVSRSGDCSGSQPWEVPVLAAFSPEFLLMGSLFGTYTHTNSLATHPDEPTSSWAVLVLPGIGLFMAVILLDFLIATDSIWARFMTLVNPRPPLDWRYFVAWIVSEALVFLPILAISGGLIWLTYWIPLLQPIAHHVRRDWSLLSFVIYGVACLPIMITGDEYRGLGSYQLGSLALLVSGALVYLRPVRAWPRLWGLLVALGLAFGLLAIGVYLLYPQQTWAAHTPFPRWRETVSPLISVAALGLLMLAPAAIELLPNKSGPSLE